MKRGEVWWAEHPVGGRRPALVLTRDAAIERLTEILIVPSTSSVRDIPTHVRLDESDGMRSPGRLPDGPPAETRAGLPGAPYPAALRRATLTFPR